MKAYGEPIIEHFATHEEKASGFSLVQLIETSAITGHFCDINGDFYLDIFSCKSFSVDIAKEIVYSYFKPKEIKTVIWIIKTILDKVCKIFPKIDCEVAIQSVQKSSRSEPSSRFFGRLKRFFAPIGDF